MAVFEQQHEGVQWFIPLSVILFIALLIQVVVIDRLKYVADFGTVLLFMSLLTGGVAVDWAYYQLRPDRKPQQTSFERPIQFFIASVSLPAFLLLIQPTAFVATPITGEVVFAAVVVFLFAGCEEFLCRKEIPKLAMGMVTQPSMRRYATVVGYFLGNVVFAILHFGVGVQTVIWAFFAGVLLSLVFEYTNSFMGIVTAHWGWNMLALGLGFTVWLLVVAALTLLLSLRGYL